MLPLNTGLAVYYNFFQFISVVPILKHCDEVRNKVLPNLGVRLEDQDNAPAVIKLLDAETIRKEREVSLAQPWC